jgi:hypothetical protein
MFPTPDYKNTMLVRSFSARDQPTGPGFAPRLKKQLAMARTIASLEALESKKSPDGSRLRSDLSEHELAEAYELIDSARQDAKIAGRKMLGKRLRELKQHSLGEYAARRFEEGRARKDYSYCVCCLQEASKYSRSGNQADSGASRVLKPNAEVTRIAVADGNVSVKAARRALAASDYRQVDAHLKQALHCFSWALHHTGLHTVKQIKLQMKRAKQKMVAVQATRKASAVMREVKGNELYMMEEAAEMMAAEDALSDQVRQEEDAERQQTLEDAAETQADATIQRYSNWAESIVAERRRVFAAAQEDNLLKTREHERQTGLLFSELWRQDLAEQESRIAADIDWAAVRYQSDQEYADETWELLRRTMSVRGNIGQEDEENTTEQKHMQTVVHDKHHKEQQLAVVAMDAFAAAETQRAKRLVVAAVGAAAKLQAAATEKTDAVATADAEAAYREVKATATLIRAIKAAVYERAAGWVAAEEQRQVDYSSDADRFGDLAHMLVEEEDEAQEALMAMISKDKDWTRQELQLRQQWEQNLNSKLKEEEQQRVVEAAEKELQAAKKQREDAEDLREELMGEAAQRGRGGVANMLTYFSTRHIRANKQLKQSIVHFANRHQIKAAAAAETEIASTHTGRLKTLAAKAAEAEKKVRAEDVAKTHEKVAKQRLTLWGELSKSLLRSRYEGHERAQVQLLAVQEKCANAIILAMGKFFAAVVSSAEQQRQQTIASLHGEMKERLDFFTGFREARVSALLEELETRALAMHAEDKGRAQAAEAMCTTIQESAATRTEIVHREDLVNSRTHLKADEAVITKAFEKSGQVSATLVKAHDQLKTMLHEAQKTTLGSLSAATGAYQETEQEVLKNVVEHLNGIAARRLAQTNEIVKTLRMRGEVDETVQSKRVAYIVRDVEAACSYLRQPWVLVLDRAEQEQERKQQQTQQKTQELQQVGQLAMADGEGAERGDALTEHVVHIMLHPEQRQSSSSTYRVCGKKGDAESNKPKLPERFRCGPEAEPIWGASIAHYFEGVEAKAARVANGCNGWFADASTDGITSITKLWARCCEQATEATGTGFTDYRVKERGERKTMKTQGEVWARAKYAKAMRSLKQLEQAATSEHIDRGLALAADWKWRSQLGSEEFKHVGGQELVSKGGNQRHRGMHLMKNFLKSTSASLGSKAKTDEEKMKKWLEHQHKLHSAVRRVSVDLSAAKLAANQGEMPSHPEEL